MHKFVVNRFRFIGLNAVKALKALKAVKAVKVVITLAGALALPLALVTTFAGVPMVAWAQLKSQVVKPPKPQTTTAGADEKKVTETAPAAAGGVSATGTADAAAGAAAAAGASADAKREEAPTGTTTATGNANSKAGDQPKVYSGAIQQPKPSPSQSPSGSPQAPGGGVLQQLMNMGGGSGAGSGAGAGGRSGGGDSGLGPQSNVQFCGEAKPDPTALRTALDCAAVMMNSSANEKMALVDTGAKLMFIIDRKTGQPVGCVRVSTGKNGTGSQPGQTPRGLLITAPHGGPGTTYKSNATGTNRDCIGLRGTDPETSVRAARGCIIHPAHGGAGRNATLGCIGIEDSKFMAVKNLLYGSDAAPKKTAIYVFDRTSKTKCPRNSAGAWSPGSDNSGTGR